MNYGHQTTYNTAQVETDFTYLKSVGITRLRIVYPGYANTSEIANCQDMVLRALAHGFYVVWGVSTGYASDVTSTIWSAFKTYVTGTLAAWAQANGLPEFALGNEGELQADGTTLTSAMVRSDIRAMCSTVKSGGYTGKVTYSTSVLDTYRSGWVAEGIGSLDLIGWNSYDTLINFQTRNTAIMSAFGNRTYISEFGSISTGYADYNDETAWYNDSLARIQSMQNANVPSGYFFCYRDGGFGVSADTFALQLSTGATRLALKAVLGDLSPVNHGLYGHP